MSTTYRSTYQDPEGKLLWCLRKEHLCLRDAQLPQTVPGRKFVHSAFPSHSFEDVRTVIVVMRSWCREGLPLVAGYVDSTRLSPVSRSAYSPRRFNPLIPTLKPQSNGPLYNNMVIGTLAVDGSPPRYTKCNSHPSTASVPTSNHSMCFWTLKG